ncbi:MAG: DUF1127 domain-containing protein [Marivibrio sp.]|uniref:DUF1127 domain-containing protein n=1 Tax=Marivibrio sp. TaxID=2039719 RepID=UPI0032ED8C5A
MPTIKTKPGSFGSQAAFLAGSDRSGSIAAQRAALRGSRQPVGWIAMLWAALRRWQERAESRSHIRELDARLLRDIGVSRAEIESEIAKPFWRP